MKIQRVAIVLSALLVVLLIQSARIGPLTVTAQSQTPAAPTLHSEEPSETQQSVAGISFTVGIDVKIDHTPWSVECVFVYLPAASFTVENLEKIFLHISEQHPDAETFYISAFSDRQRFQKACRELLALQATHWDEIRGTDSMPSNVERGLSAEYHRTDQSESYTYYPGTENAQPTQINLTQSGRTSTPADDAATAFVSAAKMNDLETITELLGRGVDVNIKTRYGSTALAEAAARNMNDLAQLLLEKGADVNQTTSSGWTPLMCAIMRRDAAILGMVLARQPDVNIKTHEGLTALMIAVGGDRIKLVRELLARGADPNIKDVWGRTALTLAREHHHAEITQLLLEAKATQ